MYLTNSVDLQGSNESVSSPGSGAVALPYLLPPSYPTIIHVIFLCCCYFDLQHVWFQPSFFALGNQSVVLKSGSTSELIEMLASFVSRVQRKPQAGPWPQPAEWEPGLGSKHAYVQQPSLILSLHTVFKDHLWRWQLSSFPSLWSQHLCHSVVLSGPCSPASCYWNRKELTALISLIPAVLDHQSLGSPRSGGLASCSWVNLSKMWRWPGNGMHSVQIRSATLLPTLTLECSLKVQGVPEEEGTAKSCLKMACCLCGCVDQAATLMIRVICAWILGQPKSGNG